MGLHDRRDPAYNRGRMMISRFIFIGMVLACFAAAAAPRRANLPLEAQPANPARRAAPRSAGAPADPMLIDASAPIVNLLTRAEEGIARQDWKFAIDSLQRVIDEPEGSLVERPPSEVPGDNGVLYESARRQANRRLATLPPEGLEAYRVLFDGKAKSLLERARAAHDATALRTMADRFLLTQYGDDACELASAWALDEGRPGEALAMLRDLRELVPDSDIPAEHTAAQFAAAYALLGDGEQASLVIEEYESAEGGRKAPGWLRDLAHFNPGGGWSGASALVGPARATAADAVPYRPQPATNPSLDLGLWEHALPAGGAEWWRWIQDDGPSGPLILPGVGLAWDSDRLFVRHARGTTALDSEDLSLVWSSTENRPGLGSPRTRAARPGGQEQEAEDPLGQALSAAHGMVFTLERGTVPIPAAVRGGRIVIRGGQPERAVEPRARLMAWDAASGALRWTRGGSTDPADPMAGAHFRGPPIAVGADVWVPYFRQTDLYLAVLRPEDGELKKSVLLGSVRAASDPRPLPIRLRLADGVVFVPSGHGALFAVDALDTTVRWARQYSRDSRTRSDSGSARGWLAAEPMVAGGVVVLPAVDQRDLLAFSSVSGELRWTAPVEGAAYLIASSADRMWVGGRSISCLSLTSGEPLWKTHLIATPTGRAALCGEVVYVPTAKGLLALHAETGEAAGLSSLAASQPPLGDLLCTGTALYSADPSSIRKFPDIERTHAVAEREFAADRTNPDSVRRLAWAELLGGSSRRAWDLAHTLSERMGADGADRDSSVARVEVEAALRLAGQSASGSDEALRWLQAAEGAAANPADRWRCRLAIGEHFATTGRYEDAYRALLVVGRGADAGQVLRVSDGVEGAARADIVRRLRELDAELSEDARRRLHAESLALVEEAIRRLETAAGNSSARGELEAWAQLGGSGPTAHRALFALVGWDRERQAFESAEVRLRASALRLRDPLAAAAALVELCSLYDASAENWAEALQPCLNELEARYAAVTFDGADHRPATISAGVSVGEWAGQVRSRLKPADRGPGIGPEADPLVRNGLSADYAWNRHANEPNPPPAGRLVEFEGPIASSLQDRIFEYRSSGKFECIDASTGETLWETDLRLPGDFESLAATNPTAPPAPDQWRRAVADGQVGVVNTGEGLFAVGLVTGRRLWARPFEVFDEPAQAYLRDRAMAAGDGIVAATPREGRLTVMRLLDGTTVWERDLRGERVNRIALHGNRIVTVDGGFGRVHLFDRENGTLIQQVLFRQPNAAAPTIQLVRTAGQIIGPDISATSNAVVAVNLESGEPTWRVELDLPIVQLFKAQEGYLGIGFGQGLVRVVDAGTGETVVEHTVVGGQAVSGGVLVDGTLVVRMESAKAQRPVVELHAFDVATGEHLWQRSDVGALPASDDPVPLYEGLIPALTDSTQTEVNQAGAVTPRTRTALTLIDVRTGLNAGQVVDVTPTTVGTKFAGDIVLRSGVVIVAGQKGLYALRTKPIAPTDPGRDF